MAADAAAAEWARRLSRVESRNVTSLNPPPPFWVEAVGAEVRDAAGKAYLDLTGAFGVALAGHRHPRIAERIRRQSHRLIHGMGDIHPPVVKVELLERLTRCMPWADTRAVLGLSGSDAVEAALKTAHLATGRLGILAFEGGYHGLTLGALATTHRSHFRQPFVERLAEHVHYLPFPTSPSDADRVLERVSGLLGGGAKPPIGAVIVEPIQGRAGVRVPPAGFMAKLAARVRAGGALLVADEVFTGMGRTGAMFACDHDRVIPDLVCVGKALGGGMPLSACCGPAAVMDAWPASGGEAIHTSTFLGHPLGCAAALGFLSVLESEDLVARATRLGALAIAYLASGLGMRDGVAEVRGRGLMIGIDLRCPGMDAPAARVAARALDRGLIVLPAGREANVVELTPPATISWLELERGLEILVGTTRDTARSAR